MSLTFHEAFDRLLIAEGGYVNDPDDPGGETKYGISKRSYPHVNIKALTKDAAKIIYYEDFWKPLGEACPPAIKFAAFDFAVNSGIQTAIRKLQKAIGVADDGHFGPLSRDAVVKMAISDVLFNYHAERLEFMRSLSTFKKYGGGWVMRIVYMLRYAAKDNEV